jgi:hypothetical protein
VVIKLLHCHVGLTLMNHKLYSSLQVQNESIKPICLTWCNVLQKGGNALVFNWKLVTFLLKNILVV